jgi:heat shock protein HslJ
MRRFLLSVVAAAALVPVLAACSPSTGSSEPSDSPQPTGTRQPGELVGTWTLDETFDAPEQPFIAFVQDNTWTASDGCNRVQGTWELSPSGVLTTTSGPQTMIACDGAQLPLAVMFADAAEVDGDTLTITSSGRSTVTTLVRTTARNVGLQGFPIGYWVEEATPTSPFLSISADRTFSGNDGCNVLRGEWESTGDGAITLTQGATTLMECPGQDPWLGRAASALLRNGVLTLQDASGTVLGQLTPPPGTDR